MKEKVHNISRRGFLKSAIATSGTLMLSSLLPADLKGTRMMNELNEDKTMKYTDELLRGVSDIHIHAAPDSVNRSINEYSMAVDAYKAGYKSIMFKSNDFSCHDRAYLIRQMLPGFEVFGSLVMNRVHGDKVNVRAAEKAVATTGHYCRCIWMPTSDAVYQLKMTNSKETGIPVVDDRKKVLPEVIRVMEICAEADIIFATGHSSPEESILMALKAKEIGLKKFVITHANSMMWKMTKDQINQCIDSGAFIEYCFITNLWGEGTGLPSFPRMSTEEFASFAKINPERSFITTDLGQVGMPHPIEGMRTCIVELLKVGVSQQDIDLLVRENPVYLMGIK